MKDCSRGEKFFMQADLGMLYQVLDRPAFFRDCRVPHTNH